MKQKIKKLIAVLMVATLTATATPITANAASDTPTQVTTMNAYRNDNATEKCIWVTWSMVESVDGKMTGDKCDGYEVQYKLSTSNTWTSIDIGWTQLEKTIHVTKNGKYQIRVRAYEVSDSGTTYGAWSKTKTVDINTKKPTQVKGLTVKPDKYSDERYLSWKNVSNASGYQIAYKTSNAKTYKQVKIASDMCADTKQNFTNYSHTLTGRFKSFSSLKLKATKTYKIKVRAYNKVSSKKVKYGAWSKVITVKPTK